MFLEIYALSICYQYECKVIHKTMYDEEEEEDNHYFHSFMGSSRFYSGIPIIRENTGIVVPRVL